MAIMSPNFRNCHNQIVNCKFLSLYGLLLLINNFACSHQQSITLLDYRQEDSSTKCTNGLLSDVDIVVYKSRVEYSQDPTMKHVFFFIKRKIDELFILEKRYNIQKDCHDVNSSECNHIDEHTVEIYLHIKASKDISGARLRGKLITSSQKDIFSDDQIIPEIYDSKDHNVVLLINGEQQNVYNGDCNYNVSDSDLSIFVMLESKLSPFSILMSSKDPYIQGNGHAVQGNGHAEYHLKTIVSIRFNITIEYFPCSMDVHVNTIQCNILIAHTEKLSIVSPETCSVTAKIFLTILALLQIIIIGIYLLIIYLLKRLCKTRSKLVVVDQGTELICKPEPLAQQKGEKEEQDDVRKISTKTLAGPDSPLPKEDHCEIKDEEAIGAHKNYISMKRFRLIKGPDNTERNPGRRTIQENDHEVLLDMFKVQKK